MSTIRIRTILAAITAAVLCAAAVARPAEAAVTVPQTFADSSDYCLGQCNDILPAGENGTATLTQILANKLFGTQPKHAEDQLAPYADLANSYKGLTSGTLKKFFNDASFTVSASNTESTISPGGRSDVKIVRDTTGIPHVYGTTRAGTEFGAGYAAGQDRLWLMDVLRHLGRGQLSSFAGGAASNRALEQHFYRAGAYTEADREAQVQRIATGSAQGAKVYQDVLNYIAGINQYISDAKRSLSFPGEYDLTGNSDALGNGIQPFKPTDLIAMGTVISALFGSSSANQLQSAIVKLAAEEKYGKAKGDAVWAGLRDENNTEAVTTIHDGSTFPYAASPANPVGVAMPDAGSVTAEPLVYAATGSAATAAKKAAALRTARVAALKTTNSKVKKLSGVNNKGVLPADLLNTKRGMSNALVVSAKYSEGGHPVAVFGPQTGYFAPQMLMLEDLHGPGIQARGAAFSGLGMYVELGRGEDYAWSATSSGQNMVDTFAVHLCNTNGTAATSTSTAYLFHGVCTPMEKIAVTNAWSPTIADTTAAGSYQLVAYRTKYGIVQDRATIGGKPVAYTNLRSTYNNEASVLLGFEEFNDPGVITGPVAFQQAAYKIGYAFNWFYVDSKHTAYFNSGLDPTRAANVDPNLPIWGDAAYEWRNWNPDTNVVANTPFATHPQSIDQDYYVSWNNKIALGATAGGWGQGSIFRVNLLDSRVKALINSGTPVTRVALTQAMEDAALTDLRGEDVLPTLLKVIDTAPVTDPTQKAALATLRGWLADGAKRQESSAGSKTYADSAAIQLMDAWWPLLAQAEFEPSMGTALYTDLTNVLSVDETPGGTHAGVAHQGSSFESGWWSYVDADLRTVLGQKVSSGLGNTFCGNGSLSACRTALLTSLTAAAAEPASAVYPAAGSCAAGDQWCSDSIIMSPLGGITHKGISWQNRPTFQQVVQFPAGRGDNIANLALGRPATASSYEHGWFQPSYPASNATDGNLSTRWSSAFSDNQQITVDLGSAQTVGRVLLRWEASHATAYQIQVSTDGVNYQTVYSTTAGSGGNESVDFTPTTARYVRMQGIKRADNYGYSLYEFEVYAS